MRQAAKDVESHAIKHMIGMQMGTEDPQLPAATQSRAVAQLLSMKARYEQRTGANEEVCGYLRQLPDDQTAEPLGELYFRLTQLMREVEHLHGMHGQEPAPWMLLCRDRGPPQRHGGQELDVMVVRRHGRPRRRP